MMSPSAQVLWLTGIGSFLIGVAITWLLTRSSNRQQQELNETKNRLEQYRRQVEQHFIHTADAVDELNRSYQKVFEHLSQGAEKLMGTEAYQREAEKRADRSITLAYLSSRNTVAPATTPMPERPVPADAPELPQNTLEDGNAASNAAPVFSTDTEPAAVDEPTPNININTTTPNPLPNGTSEKKP